MSYNPDEPDIAGTIQSKKLTPIQQNITDYLAYFAKVVKVISESETIIRVEKPRGFEEFQKRITYLQETDKEPTPEEYKKLEDEIRYETLHKPLGNATSIMNHILTDAMSGNDWNQLMESARKEAGKIAKKAQAFSSAIGKDNRDLL